MIEDLMRSKAQHVIDLGLTSHERIFPIINKFDRIWNHHNDKSFTEVVEILAALWYEKGEERKPNDLEFTKLLDEYIDRYQIK